MSKSHLIYPAFERFWHWSQAVLIFLLLATGFEIHGSYQFFGFRQAVQVHSAAAILFLVLIAFAIFWHVTTGEWKQYVPSLDNVRAQIEYYISGIFRNAPHPTRKTALSKLNPLQKVVYAGLKVIVIPLMVTSGVFYLFYRFPTGNRFASMHVRGLETVAVIHTVGAFLLLAFLVSHLYLMTTGHTVFSNLRAMVTGYEELEDELAAEDAAQAGA